MKRNVLYLSYDGMTDPLGQSQVLPYLREIAKSGYTIHLVSYEKQDRFKKHRQYIQQICDEANIHWHPQDYVVGGGIRNTIRQVRRMLRIAFYLHDKHQFSMVHCRSYIAALAGLALKRKKGLKFIFDMRGFWADERVEGGIWDIKNPLYRTIYKYFKRKEKLFFKEADYTISLTHAGKDEIKSWDVLKGTDLKIEVIPCCVDLELFDPKKIETSEEDQLRNKLGISENDFVLGYIGSIGTWYMLNEMLQYFRLLQEKNDHAKFLFVTGEKSETIINAAKENNVDPNRIIITSSLHKDVPLHMALFDQSIFFIRSTFSKKASSPTKQGEIMAMGIPLICNSGVGDTDEIVKKYHAGYVVSQFNKESMIAALNDDSNYDENEIISGAKDYYSLDEGVKHYLKVYEAIQA